MSTPFLLALLLAACGSAVAFSFSSGCTNPTGSPLSACQRRRGVCRNFVQSISAVGKAATVVDKADAWIREQTLGQLLAKNEIKKLLKEIDEDEQFWVQQRPKFESIFDEIEGHLRQEQRPLGSILRQGLKKQLLEQIENADVDGDVIKAFMRTPAVEVMLSIHAAAAE